MIIISHAFVSITFLLLVPEYLIKYHKGDLLDTVTYIIIFIYT